MTAKHSFDPVADDRTRVLLLGSLPGEQSLALRQYYGNPRNQFWRLIGAVIETDLAPLSYETRLETLRSAGVGLWDVIAFAEREGSLDASIRNHEPNRLAEAHRKWPLVRAAAFNGAKSAQIGVRLLGESGLELVPLPSSSPAYTLPFEAKLAEWLRLRAFL